MVVQVLPGLPSFGEKLAGALGQAATDVGLGLVKRIENQKNLGYEKILTDPNSSPIEKANAFMKLPEGVKKSSAPIWSAILGPQTESDIASRQFNELFGNIAPGIASKNGPHTNEINSFDTSGAKRASIDENSPPHLNNEPRSNVLDPKDLSTWPDEALSKAAGFEGSKGTVGVIGKSAKNEIDRRERERKKFVDERTFHEKGASKAEERAAALRESIPKKEMALGMAREAVNSGEVGVFSLNNLAERLNIPELKTAKGAQLITASKEALLGNLAKISAKAQNQWMEQRLNSMFPAIGQTEEANETILAMLDAETKLDRAYLDAFNELSTNDVETHGYIKNDIDKRASELASSKYDSILNETSYKLRQAYEKERGILDVEKNVNKKVAKGTPLTLETARIMLKKNNNDFDSTIKNAERLGYRIPTSDEIKQWLQVQ